MFLGKFTERENGISFKFDEFAIRSWRNDEVIVTVIATGFDDAREQIGGLDNDLPKNPSYMGREDDFDDISEF